MYQPPHFREERLDVQHALIVKQPLGLLITSGPGGLQANYIPFLIDAAASERGTLRAHLARANPQAHELAVVSECLVVFAGPQHYISPSLYATKHETGKVVPTWNYITVHAWGAPRVVDDAGWLRRQIGDLTQHQEQSQAAPWQVNDAPETFIAAQIKGIIGLEIPIARLEGKWKVSQNRPAIDQSGVVAGLSGAGEEANAMAIEVAARSNPASR
ncbi:MAG: FMN-binding negative transcriptional regulator [Pseudolabrys sp.]|jgi:transcriptional regulator